MEGKLILILVASGSKPLSSYSPYQGNFIEICNPILSKIKKDSSEAIKFDEYFIFYLNQDNITYLIMTGLTFPKETAVGCLESLKKDLSDTLKGRNFKDANKYALDNELKGKLKVRYVRYDYINENPEYTSEDIENYKKEINKMKDEILYYNDLLNQREDHLSEMEKKADILGSSSEDYYKGAIKVRKSKKCQIF